ncbi:hypothetical protein F511_23394 [Dorcoceras hygrometricum]|uniref:Uncharacterized protein n=1 Tax=Dorcoceras hygrometricum TaxID=472368 RepID=A0A2Z7APM9_9LAMI|nr:hypothetical protein F511_23394 [Dorcoceras hygrometricum]
MSDDEQSVDERIDADEAMSLEDILLSIPVDVPLPSAGVDITKIILEKDIKIPGVDERTRYLASLPQIPVDDKGKEPLMEKDPVKGNPVKEQFLLILADIECLVQLREKLIQNVRQDGRNLDDVQTLRFNEFKKGFLAHSAAVTADSMDFRKEFRALNAKVTSLDEQGEVSRNRPQPPPDDQNRGSGNSGGGSGVRFNRYTIPGVRPGGGPAINENHVRLKGARGRTAARIQRRATPRPAAAARLRNASSHRRFVRPAGASSRTASQHKCTLRRATGAPPTSTSASSIGHRRAQKRPASALYASSSSGAPSRDDSEKRRPSMRGQRACTARVHARGGAPPCAAVIPVGISIPFSSRF